MAALTEIFKVKAMKNDDKLSMNNPSMDTNNKDKNATSWKRKCSKFKQNQLTS